MKCPLFVDSVQLNVFQSKVWQSGSSRNSGDNHTNLNIFSTYNISTNYDIIFTPPFHSLKTIRTHPRLTECSSNFIPNVPKQLICSYATGGRNVKEKLQHYRRRTPKTLVLYQIVYHSREDLQFQWKLGFRYQ